MICSQLDALKQKCATLDGKRQYVATALNKILGIPALIELVPKR